MTTTQTAELTLSFSHDNGESITKVRAEVEFYEYYHQVDEKMIRDYRVEFLEPFDKSVHGAWQMELSEQIKTL